MFYCIYINDKFTINSERSINQVIVAENLSWMEDEVYRV